MRGIDRISTISEKMRRRIVKKGISEDHVYLFPNWADTEFVRPLKRDDEIRREFGTGPDDVLVLHAGNMGEKQGLELILDAAEQLRERSEIKFAIVGAGAARERLQRIPVSEDWTICVSTLFSPWNTFPSCWQRETSIWLCSGERLLT